MTEQHVNIGDNCEHCGTPSCPIADEAEKTAEVAVDAVGTTTTELVTHTEPDVSTTGNAEVTEPAVA